MYGHDYEGRRRECDHCGHFTNVHTYCYTCEMNVCEGCQDDHTCRPPHNMKIRTACIAPPVPSRDFDYTAWVDGQEEWLQGYGATAALAIQDLEQQIEERAA